MNKTAKTIKSIGKQIATIADLIPDDRNANKGSERGSGMIEKSLRSYGAGRSILADKNGKVIAGNKTLEGAVNAGIETIRVVQTSGNELVVVQRTDIDLDTKTGRELAVMDNRAGQISLEWDGPQLQSLADDFDIGLKDIGFDDKEMAKLLGEEVIGEGEMLGNEKWMVVVICNNEADQVAFLEQMQTDGRECRALLG